MLIRECREADLDLLERHYPSPGRTRFHEERFGRQREGTSTFLTVWVDGTPVGSGEIRWNGCRADEVLNRYPDCPEINGLTVWPAERQSRGIGTAIIHAAEDLAVQRGFRRVGLGVDDGNVRAATLYLRLGYQETGCRYVDSYHYIDDDAIRHDFADPCRFLIKSL